MDISIDHLDFANSGFSLADRLGEEFNELDLGIGVGMGVQEDLLGRILGQHDQILLPLPPLVLIQEPIPESGRPPPSGNAGIVGGLGNNGRRHLIRVSSGVIHVGRPERGLELPHIWDGGEGDVGYSHA